MKKTIVKSAILVLLTFNFGCTDNEKDVVISTPAMHEEQIVIQKLPDNVISLDKIIEDYNNSLNNQFTIKGLNRRSKGGGGLDTYTPSRPSSRFDGYQKIFVLYPVHWSLADRIRFYGDLRLNAGVTILTEIDSCEYVDTFYFPEDSIIPGKDRKKNLIVASG